MKFQNQFQDFASQLKNRPLAKILYRTCIHPFSGYECNTSERTNLKHYKILYEVAAFITIGEYHQADAVKKTF